jgi:hypothetical protein
MMKQRERCRLFTSKHNNQAVNNAPDKDIGPNILAAAFLTHSKMEPCSECASQVSAGYWCTTPWTSSEREVEQGPECFKLCTITVPDDRSQALQASHRADHTKWNSCVNISLNLLSALRAELVKEHFLYGRIRLASLDGHLKGLPVLQSLI